MTYAKQNTISKNSSSSNATPVVIPTVSEPKPKRKYKKRAPKTQTNRIRTLRALGHRPSEIAAMVGCAVQTVYNTNTRDNKAQRQKDVKALKQKAALADWVEEQQAVLQQKVWLVPKPKLSWAHRFKVLFTGVV